MFRAYMYCVLLVVVLFTFTSTATDQVEDDGHWPWTHTKYLTRSNWTTLLKANEKSSKIHHSVWFIFYYLNYCGHCKQQMPGWETAAEYAAGMNKYTMSPHWLTFIDDIGWSRYIKIGAYDCASETSEENDICVDDAYPQWRIYCPSTNATQLAFDSGRLTASNKPEEILMWSIKKINKIGPDCYGKSWPIRPAIE